MTEERERETSQRGGRERERQVTDVRDRERGGERESER